MENNALSRQTFLSAGGVTANILNLLTCPELNSKNKPAHPLLQCNEETASLINKCISDLKFTHELLCFPLSDKGTSGGSDYRPRAAALRHPGHLSAPVYTEVLL